MLQSAGFYAILYIIRGYVLKKIYIKHNLLKGNY